VELIKKNDTWADDPGVEEWEVESGAPRSARRFMRYAYLSLVGNKVNEDIRDNTRMGIAFGRTKGVEHAHSEPKYGPKGGLSHIWINVWGEDENKVNKAFNDRVAQAKAELLGIA
jgi:hypothetical protein